MILETDLGKFCVHVRHIRNESTRKTEVSIHPYPCVSQQRPCGTITELVGVSSCHPKDAFDKAKGRKLAIERAIQHLSRDERKSIWTAYLGKHPPSR